MLVTAAGLVLIGLSLSLPGILRVRGRARALSRSLALYQDEIAALLEEQARLQEAAGRSGAPARRLVRWLRHPLVVAFWTSFRMRRRDRR